LNAQNSTNHKTTLCSLHYSKFPRRGHFFKS